MRIFVEVALVYNHYKLSCSYNEISFWWRTSWSDTLLITQLAESPTPSIYGCRQGSTHLVKRRTCDTETRLYQMHDFVQYLRTQFTHAFIVNNARSESSTTITTYRIRKVLSVEPQRQARLTISSESSDAFLYHPLPLLLASENEKRGTVSHLSRRSRTRRQTKGIKFGFGRYPTRVSIIGDMS